MNVLKVKKAVQQSVFGIVLLIVHMEGASALYDGLSAQLLKGFFEHGLTMLMKERIMAVVRKLYMMLMRTSRT